MATSEKTEGKDRSIGHFPVNKWFTDGGYKVMCSCGKAWGHVTPTHIPFRDDDVVRWLKTWRDEYSENPDVHAAIDDMLDDYREHADTGAPLYAAVEHEKM
jgi:hypothetical protein